MSRLEKTYEYVKLRKEFGVQPQFSEQGPTLCDSIPPDIVEQKKYILRNPVNEAVQNTPNFSVHEVNTIRAEYTSTGMNHTEGGWPKDVNIADPEATMRYRRREEKDDDYIHCVNAVKKSVQHYIFQNNAIDMYQSYFAEMAPVPEVESVSLRTMNRYTDPGLRPLTSISWEPETGHRIAVNYLDVDFYLNSKVPLSALIWNIDKSNEPEFVLRPPVPMFDLQYNPRDQNILAGGLATGQFAYWDRRVGENPAGVSALHVAHRDIAKKLVFIHSKTGMDLFTGGPDGCLKWWDLRNLNETTDECIIDVVKLSTDTPDMARSLGISVIEYEPTIPTRFMVGTDNGFVVSGNRKGKTQLEKLPYKFDAHAGPVFALQRSPSFPKNFLTVGDWSFKIWNEECRESPVLWSKLQRHKITNAEWSPTKPPVMMVTSSDGNLRIWNFLTRQDQHILEMKVSQSPLLTLKFQEAGSLVAVGSKDGTVTLIELSHSLVETKHNDKSLFISVLDREAKRERILEARIREIKLKLRQAEEGASPKASVTDIDPTVGDKDLQEAANDFFTQVKKEQANMN